MGARFRSCLPTLVSVIGPAGVGKTTLAAGFCARAAESGARVISGRSLPYRESGAYGALAGQIMRIAGVFESDSPDTIVAKLRAASADVLGGTETDPDAVARDLPRSSASAASSQAADRNALFYSVREFFEGPLASSPTIARVRGHPLGRREPARPRPRVGRPDARVPLMILTLARPELCDQRPNWGSGLPDFLTLTLGPRRR